MNTLKSVSQVAKAASVRFTDPTVKADSLVLSAYAFNKISYLANKATTEIGFWCIGDKEDPLYINDVIVLRQKATVVHNEFNNSALADYMGRMAEEGYGIDEFALVWGHTHPAGCSADPSSTDEATFGGKDRFGNKKRLVMFIMSQDGDMYARLRDTTPLCTVETELKIQVDFTSIGEMVEELVSRPDIVGEWDKDLLLVEVGSETISSFTWTGTSSGKVKKYKDTTQGVAAPSKVFGMVDEDDEEEDPRLPGGLTNAYWDHDDLDYLQGHPSPDLSFIDNLMVETVTMSEEGGIESIEEIPDDRFEEIYGCTFGALEEVYLIFCHDVSGLSAAAFIKYCGEKVKSPFKDWGTFDDLTDALKMVGFNLKKKETTRQTLARFFQKNKRAKAIYAEMEEEVAL